MLNLLKKGLAFSHISSEESFLAFYKVLEIISDDLKQSKDEGRNSDFLKDIIKYNLVERPSQRLKIYFLVKFLDIEDFNLSKYISIADTRNDLSHSDKKINENQAMIVQNLAFSAFNKYLLRFN